MQTTVNSTITSDARLLFGLLIGVLIMWLLASANSRWRRGKGLQRVPDGVRRENEERMWQAKNGQVQGYREMVRAVGQFAAAGVIVFC